MEKNWQRAKEFAGWKQKLIENWNKIKIQNIMEENELEEVSVGSNYVINAEVNLGNLTPDDVEVQIYYGKIDDKNKSGANDYVTMECLNTKARTKAYKYRGEINCKTTGNFGYTLRILPNHELLINQFELGLIRWAH